MTIIFFCFLFWCEIFSHKSVDLMTQSRVSRDSVQRSCIRSTDFTLTHFNSNLFITCYLYTLHTQTLKYASNQYPTPSMSSSSSFLSKSKDFDEHFSVMKDFHSQRNLFSIQQTISKLSYISYKTKYFWQLILNVYLFLRVTTG